MLCHAIAVNFLYILGSLLDCARLHPPLLIPVPARDPQVALQISFLLLTPWFSLLVTAEWQRRTSRIYYLIWKSLFMMVAVIHTCVHVPIALFRRPE